MKIKNWEKFQHYKNRRPPWIKFHVETLEDRAIMLLAPFDYRVLTLSWLINSKNGSLPELPDLAFQLRITEKELTESLQRLEDFIDIGDSKMLAKCLQVTPESSPETETETETEKSKTLRSAKTADPYSENFENLWKKYPRPLGKREAYLKFNKQVVGKDAVLDIHKALENYKLDVETQRKNGHPDLQWQHGSTWFNSRWKDYVNYKPTPKNVKVVNGLPLPVVDEVPWVDELAEKANKLYVDHADGLVSDEDAYNQATDLLQTENIARHNHDTLIAIIQKVGDGKPCSPSKD